jgi:hypothetical protein
MNLNDTITGLLKQGCQNVTFLMSPEKACVVQAEQLVATGQKGNFTRVMHQREGGNFVDCLNQVAQHVGHVAELENLIAMPLEMPKHIIPIKIHKN